jgi:hypothetical protein
MPETSYSIYLNMRCHFNSLNKEQLATLIFILEEAGRICNRDFRVFIEVDTLSLCNDGIIPTTKGILVLDKIIKPQPREE